MPKKKSTGMSQRQSFLDRGVVAENRAILRYNEDLEREARRAERGESGPEPASEGRRHGGGSRPGGGPRGGPGTRADRPQRDGRPQHDSRPQRDGSPQRDGRPAARREPPRAATPEQEAAVRAVLPAADADPVMAAGGARLVDRLVRGDRLSRASDIGWEAVAAVPTASERTATEWAALRRSWAVVVDAATAEWIKIHPDARPQRSALAELDRHVARQRPRPPAKRRTRKPKPTPGPSVQPAMGASTPTSAVVEDLIEVDVAWSAEEPAGQPGGAGGSTVVESVAADVAPKRRRRRGRRRSRRPGEPVSADTGAAIAATTAPGSMVSVEESGERPEGEQSAPASEPSTAEPPGAGAEPLPEPMGSEVPPEPEPTAETDAP